MHDQAYPDPVRTWASERLAGASVEAQLGALRDAFAALWRRTCRTLGPAATAPVARRALRDASARHEVLAPLKVDEDGLHDEELRARAAALDPAALDPAVRCAVETLLGALAELSADLLTPSLHAELARTAETRDPPGDSA